MRRTRSALTLLAVTACTALALASPAEAGTITAATGEFTVNGKATTVKPGEGVALKKGDVVDSKKAVLTYKSDTGDVLEVEAGGVVREEETTQTSAGLFIVKGAVKGSLSERTQLGAAAGTMTGPKGGKARVLVETSPGRENSEALFRAVEGSAGVAYKAFAVQLPQQHSVTLGVDPGQAGTVRFRTGQSNAGEVEIRKSTAAGVMLAYVPKASLGSITDDPGNKTRICNDINSLKTAKIRLETKFGSSKNDAAIGPGTCAVIDNATGTIELAFTPVRFEILEQAIQLTSEFSTLAQSNFSDVK